MNSPRLKPQFRARKIDGEGVCLFSELSTRFLAGRLFELVVPALDGRPTESLCRDLADRATAEEVLSTLGELKKKGLLVDSQKDSPPASLHIASVGELSTAPLIDRLRSTGVSLDDEASAALTVVVADSYLRSDLRKWNRQALSRNKPWLLAKPVGREIWLGPLFLPGQTGCWECLCERLRANHPVVAYVENRTGELGSLLVDPTPPPFALDLAWSWIATTVTSWITERSLPFLEGKIQSMELPQGRTKFHRLLRQPACPDCGEPGKAAQAKPIQISAVPKAFTQEGGHRAVSPQETLERYGHLVSPLTGAVPRLARGELSDEGVVHVYHSGHNLARGAVDLKELRHGLRGSTSGKGITDVQARASALCEGLERYSGRRRGDEPRRPASFLELGESALHPNRCMLFSETQYRSSEAPASRRASFNYVPARFDEREEIDWTPVWSLTRREVRYLPTSFCYFDDKGPGSRYCVGCSNGNAAGNTIEEAILQGFFELVERDAVALWWYNRLRRPSLDLDSFDDDYIRKTSTYLARLGRELWVLDLTSDLGIPTFAAVSRSTDSSEERIMMAFGAHLDTRIALLRAITELNQFLGKAMNMRLDPKSESETVQWLRRATLTNQPYLAPSSEPSRRASDFPSWSTTDLREDILYCQATIEQRGMQMLVLDQTRPEIGLPVAKVIVPGMRHFWARFAPGRLYDVPVAQGWLPAPKTETELNPTPMFL